jgi:hypothetical protein
MTFTGRHYETGTLANVFAAQGIVNPHTGKPYSEALMLGLSGGIAFGYFTFQYTEMPPFAILLTRNTFDPMETLLGALGGKHDDRTTTKPEIAQRLLDEALDKGQAPIVWADSMSMPYTNVEASPGWWFMTPMSVHGRSEDGYLVVDQTDAAIPVSRDDLAVARGRVKKTRYRMVTIESVDPARVAEAAREGIRTCIDLFTKQPPKGARTNFGFEGYRHLAKMLVNETNASSWAKIFPTDDLLFRALVGAKIQPGPFRSALTGGALNADRDTCASFLIEAAGLLGRPALTEVAPLCAEAGAAWSRLAEETLPASLAPFHRARELILRRAELSRLRGAEVSPEMRALDLEFEALSRSVAESLAEAGYRRADHLARIAARVDEVRIAEEAMVAALGAAIG